MSLKPDVNELGFWNKIKIIVFMNPKAPYSILLLQSIHMYY